jgi:hypothetical protein
VSGRSRGGGVCGECAALWSLRCAGGRSRSRSRKGRAAVRESRDGIGNLEVGARARASSNTQGRTIVSSTWTCFRNRDCSVQRRRDGRRVGRRVGGGNGWLQSPLAMERERRFVPTFGCRRGTGTRSDSTTVTLEPSSRGRAGGRNMVGWCWCCRGVECLAGMRSSSAMFGAIRRPLLTPTFSFHMRDSTLFTRPAAFGARCVKARAMRPGPSRLRRSLSSQQQRAAFVFSPSGMLELHLAAPPGLLIVRHHSAPPTNMPRSASQPHPTLLRHSHAYANDDVAIATRLCSVSTNYVRPVSTVINFAHKFQTVQQGCLASAVR